MCKANKDIREAIKKSGFPQWKVAEKYNLSDSRFSVILRYELDDDKKKAILEAIKELEKEG